MPYNNNNNRMVIENNTATVSLAKTPENTSLHSENEEIRRRYILGLVSLSSLFLVGMYIFFLDGIKNLISEQGYTTIPSVMVILVGFTIVSLVLRWSKLTLQDCGLTLHHWQKQVFRGITWAIPTVILFVIIKWICIAYGNLPYRLFDPTVPYLTANKFHVYHYLTFLAIYALFCPFQEFIIRGFMQTLLRDFFVGGYVIRAGMAILISNIVFGATHAHISVAFGLVAMSFGLLWGIQYEKHKSLLSVIVSHMFAGICIEFLLGFSYII
ncbi:MAG: type II CAAX endopeptidase family protein [Pseudomonadota bacterium]